MDKKAVCAARTECERAAESLQNLLASNDFNSVEKHWVAFLGSAGRVFTKLEQGSKGSTKSKDWWGTQVSQWKTDPLLRYVRHARNANEHTLQQIAQQQEATVKQVQPTEIDWQELRRQTAQRQPGVGFIPLALLEVNWAHVVVIDVVDRGTLYSIPKTHLDEPVANITPANIGGLALTYLRGMIEKAESLAL